MNPDELTWDQHYQRCVESHDWPGQERFIRYQAARKRVAVNSREDWNWLADALSHSERKYFVASIFARQPVPKRLFVPMLRAAVTEPDANRNRYFIEPCVRSFGAQSVRDALRHIRETGAWAERYGVDKALYWVGVFSVSRNENDAR